MSGDGGREDIFPRFSMKGAALRLCLGARHTGLPRQHIGPWFCSSINLMAVLSLSGASARDKVICGVRCRYLSGRQLEQWAWAAHEGIFNPSFPPACWVAQATSPHFTCLSLPTWFAPWGSAFYCVPALVCAAGASQPLLNSTASQGTLQRWF